MGPLLDYDRDQVLRAAQESTERFQQARTLGPLDGVPIAIKEEVRVSGLPTRMGTNWLPHVNSESDCTAVARLREAGAIIVGTTPMTEYGLSPLGSNTHRKLPRNIHDQQRLAGGSSTGSAVAVGSGCVPLALGADGGGSIRIPACLNGLFGLKPTFGRIPTTGHGHPGGSSMVHLGPIAASSLDLAHFTEATAGADTGDPNSSHGIAVARGELVAAIGRGVKGLRIGIDETEWAAAHADVAAPAHEALRALERDGAVLETISLRMARYAAAIGYLTIGLESYSTLQSARQRMDQLGADLQLLLASMGEFRSDDYLDAQRLRAALRQDTAAALQKVDVIALPTTAQAAPPVSDDEFRSGFVDPPTLDNVSRFSYLANLTGLPAGTAPVGLDHHSMPVGLQIIGDAWDEASVLQVLGHTERIEAASVPQPGNAIYLL